MTKDLLRKQIIISISTNNMEKVIVQSNIYISNINRLLKDIKLEISANFICSDNKEVIIIINKIVFFSNLNIVEKYMKKLNNVNSNNIMSFRLL